MSKSPQVVKNYNQQVLLLVATKTQYNLPKSKSLQSKVWTIRYYTSKTLWTYASDLWTICYYTSLLILWSSPSPWLEGKGIIKVRPLQFLPCPSGPLPHPVLSSRNQWLLLILASSTVAELRCGVVEGVFTITYQEEGGGPTSTINYNHGKMLQLKTIV